MTIIPRHGVLLGRNFTLKAAAHRHMMCEKPVARTVQDAQAMSAASRRRAFAFFVAMAVPILPQYRMIRDALVTGRIGRPAVIRQTVFAAARHFHRPRLGRFRYTIIVSHPEGARAGTVTL